MGRRRRADVLQDLLVGAGRTGYPENNQATIWTDPRIVGGS